MTEFDELEKNIQQWYYTYQTIHKKILAESCTQDEYKEYTNAMTQLQRVKKKYGTIDITDIKDLHR